MLLTLNKIIVNMCVYTILSLFRFLEYRSNSFIYLEVERCVFRVLPEATARQGEESQHGQQHPEGQQREDIQEGVHAQEEAEDHQLENKNRNTSKSNNGCQCECCAVKVNNDSVEKILR